MLIGAAAGVNLPGARLSLPALSDKDLRDLQFGIDNEVSGTVVQ